MHDLDLIDDPEYGRLRYRAFPLADLPPAHQQALEAAVAEELVLDFHFQGAELKVRRPWVEGRNVRDIFAELDDDQRSLQALVLFRKVFEELQQWSHGHGALHPNNLIIATELQLVDAVANHIFLTPPIAGDRGTDTDPWCWTPYIPPSWSIDDWDRIQLLRTAVLLSRGPQVWQQAPPAHDLLQWCHQWVDEALGELAADDDLVEVLQYCRDLLQDPPRRVPPPSPPPEARLAQILSDLARHQAPCRMLSADEEERVLALASQDGPRQDGPRQDGSEPDAANHGSRTTAATRHYLDVWLALQRPPWKREHDLRTYAQRFLRAGTYADSRVVRRSACANARRIFEQYDVPTDQAHRLAQAELAELQLKPEVDEERRWAHALEDPLARLVGRSCNTTELQRMIQSVCSFDPPVPEAVAERFVRRQLEERGIELKGA